MYTLNTSTPEAVGIPSHCIINFINSLEEAGIPMHSLLLARKERIVAEGYYAPIKKNDLHRMFSVSKTITALAINELAVEGKLSLEDPIIHHFPEYTPPLPHPYLAAMTIEHMLQMQTCYSATTFKADMNKNWVESFFISQPSHRPGTAFNYDTSASHTLCALVEKLSGMKQLDYLRSRFLDKTEFSQDAYMITDPFGVSMGGSGLMATTRDLAIIGSLLLNQGSMNNHPLIDPSFVKAATGHHSHTAINGPIIEERQGYGYQIWRLTHNGFACYGMGGQLAICLPDYDLLLATTADTQGLQGGNQTIYKVLYDTIIPYLSNDSLADNKQDQTALSDLLDNLQLTPLPTGVAPTSEINQGLLTYDLAKNDHGFTRIELKWSDTLTCELTLHQEDRSWRIPFKVGQLVSHLFPHYNQSSASSGTWLDQHTLYVKTHLLGESVGSVHFHFNFHQKGLSLYMKKQEETYFNEFNGYLESLT